jgi:hypothetical protein
MNGRLLECQRCGASIAGDVSTGAVTCQFCGAVTLIQALPTAPTPSPVNWGRPSLPKPNGYPVALFVVLGALGVTVVVATIFAAIAFSGRLGFHPTSTSTSTKTATTKTRKRPLVEVVRTPLSISMAQMSDRFPEAKRVRNSLYLDVDDPVSEKIRYDWDPSAPGHASQVYLAFSESTASQRTAWVNRLEPILGRRGVKTEQDGYEYDGCGVRMSVDAGKVDVAGQPPFDSRWQTQLQALWNLVQSIAILRTEPADAAAVRDLLGDLPFKRLADFDVRVDVDASRRAIVSTFPNVCIRSQTSVEYAVPVDHPWISHADFVWDNQRGGKLKEIRLWPKMGTKLADPAAMAECLVPCLGKTTKQETDHAKNEWAYRWSVSGGICVVYSSYVLLRGRAIGADWPKLVRTLDACGR